MSRIHILCINATFKLNGFDRPIAHLHLRFRFNYFPARRPRPNSALSLLSAYPLRYLNFCVTDVSGVYSGVM